MKFFIRIVSIVGLLSLPQSSFADTTSESNTLASQLFGLFFGAIQFNHDRINSLFSGNGTAGPLDVTSILDFNASPPADFNFSDITVRHGAWLNVPAGTTIRCTGSFKNFGTISVQVGAKLLGARRNNLSQGLMATSHPGDSYAAPNAGMYSNVKGMNMDGGRGGDPIPRAAAISSFNRFRIGGGAGGGFADGGAAFSSAGGGLLRIHCRGPVHNRGIIYANAKIAQTGTGGGGGGIIILASQTSIDNSAGVIRARGSDGGQGFTCCAPGGGGGGGIVVLAAPHLATAGGFIDVSGGSGRDTSSTASQSTVSSGGGGGASGGRGGWGGSVSPSGIFGTSGAGGDGYVIELLNDPATMLH